jgi:hypothetical protein
MLHARQSEVKTVAEVTHSSLVQDVQRVSGAHSASYAMGTRVLSQGYCDRAIQFITKLNLVPWLRMNGAKTLLPHIPS